MQNKANFREARMNVSYYLQKDCENEPHRRLCENKPKQTQFSDERKQMTDVRGQMTEDGGRTTDDRKQKAEDRKISAKSTRKLRFSVPTNFFYNCRESSTNWPYFLQNKANF